jgi:Fe-S-cluster containining protein
MPPKVTVLAPPRHACLGCGGSCQGVRVRLIGDEVTRIPAIAATLGVEQPVVDGVLRQVDGRCVFLDDANRCRIHAAHGSAAKPWICRQYPLVVARTEAGDRLGIDPGCYTAWSTWRDGPAVEVDEFAANKAERDSATAQEEQAFLGLARNGTVSGLLGALIPGGDPAAEALPNGLAGRWITRLQHAPSAMVDRPENGPSFRGALLPVLAAATTWSPDSPPPWPILAAPEDAWAVEVARRLVFLRLIPHLPVRGTALLALLGAVACAWADPRPERFGPAMSAWSRALRVPAFWSRIVPGPAELQWLATGV